MKSLINFFKELFGKRYVDAQKIEQLKEKGITPLF